MNILQPVLLGALLLAQGQAQAVNYEVSKSTSIRDDQGGSFTTQSNGMLSQQLSLVSSSTTFSSFLLSEDPRVVVSGDLEATLSGTRASYDYTLNGLLDLRVGEATHAVRFENMSVSRRGVAVEIDGDLLVDGKSYEVRDGSLAEQVIVSLIVVQGQ